MRVKHQSSLQNQSFVPWSLSQAAQAMGTESLIHDKNIAHYRSLLESNN